MSNDKAEIWTIYANNRLGLKVTIICSSKDTIGILKALIAQKCGTVVGKIQLKMGYIPFNRDCAVLDETEITNGCSLELY